MSHCQVVTASSSQDFKKFAEFWPHYLRDHLKPETRALHFAGTTIAVASLAAWFLTKQSRFLAYSLVGSYGPAWIGHSVFEHNKPASFEYPLWSLRADLLMYQKWVSGDLDDELIRAETMLQAANSHPSTQSISRPS